MKKPLVFLVLAAITGCGPGEKPQPQADSAPRVTAPPKPADSLVLKGPGTVEVWFTAAREAKAAGGESCVERALEIRQDTLHRGVPLLYTREAPTLLGKDAIRAVLYNNCVPTAAYRVDFATVSPKRLPK